MVFIMRCDWSGFLLAKVFLRRVVAMSNGCRMNVLLEDRMKRFSCGKSDRIFLMVF